MSDALGGLVNIAIIVFVSLLIIGYMAFNINYSKAFKVKNYIVSTFEKYNGKCASYGPLNSACNKQVNDYLQEVGYGNTGIKQSDGPVVDYLSCNGKVDGLEKDCDNNISCVDGKYCYKKYYTSYNLTNNTRKFYFKIVTKADIEVPVIHNVVGMINIFYIVGSTEIMEEAISIK